MNKITINDIDNSIDDIYNTQINITNVKLYIDSAIITDLFNDIPNTLVLKYKTCLNNEATIIGIDSNILKNFGDKQVYISYERGEEKMITKTVSYVGIYYLQKRLKIQ